MNTIFNWIVHYVTTLTQGQVRDDGEWPRAGDGAEDGSGGGAPHPQHGLPLGDALLPLHGHRHVRRVGAVGLPGQRLFLRNIAAQGQKSILFLHVLFAENARKYLDLISFLTFLLFTKCLIFYPDKLLARVNRLRYFTRTNFSKFRLALETLSPELILRKVLRRIRSRQTNLNSLSAFSTF